jgi:pSer/pThr/pTyr-binding forkhead associated (FHA) protein
VNLGHERIFQVKTWMGDDHKLANITMDHRLKHGDVIAFGSQFNSVATHGVSGGSTGNEMSPVYETAVHSKIWLGEKATTFHEHMGVNKGKFNVLPFQATTIKIEPGASVGTADTKTQAPPLNKCPRYDMSSPTTTPTFHHGFPVSNRGKDPCNTATCRNNTLVAPTLVATVARDYKQQDSKESFHFLPK